MLRNCFSASERSRYSCNSSLCYREKCIYYTLTCNKESIRRSFFFIGSFFTNRPSLHHRKGYIIPLFICYDGNSFFNGKTSFFYFLNCSAYSPRNHYTAFHNGRFLNYAENISGNNLISDRLFRYKVPFFLSVKRRHFNASLNICAACFI